MANVHPIRASAIFALAAIAACGGLLSSSDGSEHHAEDAGARSDATTDGAADGDDAGRADARDGAVEAQIDSPPDTVDEGDSGDAETAPPCGAPGQSCCSGNACAGSGCCVGGACYASGQNVDGGVCSGGQIVACGAGGQACCQSIACSDAADCCTSLGCVLPGNSCGGELGMCSNGSCSNYLCGGAGMACCPGNLNGHGHQMSFCTGSGLACDVKNKCVPCGDSGQRPCDPGYCNQGGCADVTGLCVAVGGLCANGQTCGAGACGNCGALGEAPCLFQNEHYCTAPYTRLDANGTTCVTCGGLGQPPCDYGCDPPFGIDNSPQPLCVECGTKSGEACCRGDACSGSLSCAPGTNTCQ